MPSVVSPVWGVPDAGPAFFVEPVAAFVPVVTLASPVDVVSIVVPFSVPPPVVPPVAAPLSVVLLSSGLRPVTVSAATGLKNLCSPAFRYLARLLTAEYVLVSSAIE